MGIFSSIASSIAGPIIGSVIGGYFSKKSDQRNIAAQKEINAQNLQAQQDMAQNQLQWRVEDAKKAGLHPLAGIGATPYQAIPTAQAYERTAGRDFGNNLAQAFSKLDFGSQKKLRDLEIERASLENELLRTNIRSIANPGIQPSVAMTKQNNSGNPLVNTNKSEITANDPTAQHITAGVKPGFDIYKVGDNEFRMVTSEKLAESTENNILQQWLTNIDGIYMVKPKWADELFQGKYNPKTEKVVFNPVSQKFKIVKKDESPSRLRAWVNAGMK